MPLLDWQAPRGASVVSDRFWIYWAVTAPLTAAVLLLWSAWYFFSSSQRARHRLAHRKESQDGSKRQSPPFEMRILTALETGHLRKRSRRMIENDTTEETLEDMA